MVCKKSLEILEKQNGESMELCICYLMYFSGEILNGQNDNRNMQEYDYDPNASCGMEVSTVNRNTDHENILLCHVHILRFYGRLRLNMAD